MRISESGSIHLAHNNNTHWWVENGFYRYYRALAEQNFFNHQLCYVSLTHSIHTTGWIRISVFKRKQKKKENCYSNRFPVNIASNESNWPKERKQQVLRIALLFSPILSHTLRSQSQHTHTKLNINDWGYPLTYIAKTKFWWYQASSFITLGSTTRERQHPLNTTNTHSKLQFH